MDNYYMNVALDCAKKAFKNNNFPVGAVIVKNNKIISKAYNTKNSKKVSIYHAEILAIRNACRKLKTWRLNDCTIYVTLEPCEMCMGAIVESRISRIVYLTESQYKTSFFSVKSKIIIDKLDDKCEYINVLNRFFINNR